MNRDGHRLSRREILGSLGAIGVASAGAGLGTSAYFSDREGYEGNTLTAGELDLKVDWEEHYADWSADEQLDRPEAVSDGPTDDGAGTFEVRMTKPTENLEAYRAFPPGSEGDLDGSSPLLWIPEAFVDDFMANTALEAYPDADGDGIAEFPIEELNGRMPCEYLADVGGGSTGLDPASDPLGRTDNADTVGVDGPLPLINLTDVKPGDFGEVTLSAHLCDNPGYLWLNMPGGLDLAENGVLEPEAADPDEDQTQDGSLKDPTDDDGPTVELADEIRTAIWYDDDCDNLLTCEEELDIMAVADTSGSIEGELGPGNGQEEIDLIEEGANTFLSQLEANADPGQVHAGLLTFNGPGEAGEPNPMGSQAVFDRPALRAGLGPLERFDVNDDGSFDVGQFLPSTGNGNTPMPHALDLAQKVLADQGRAGARQVILLVTDGLPDYTDGASPSIPYTVEENEGGPLALTGRTYTSESYDGIGGNAMSDPVEKDETEAEAVEIQLDGIEIYVAGIGLDTNDNAFLANRVAGDDGDPTQGQPSFFFEAEFDPGSPNDINTIATTLAQTLVSGPNDCEEVLFTGTLREAAAVLTANEGRGLPLDFDRDSAFDEFADPEDDPARQCFVPGVTACIGFSWWLPVDHANEIQSDSATFDLGFYTEQCRHNDGAGLTAGSPPPEA